MTNRDPVTGRFMKVRRMQKKAVACKCAKATKAKTATAKKAVKKTQKKGKKA